METPARSATSTSVDFFASAMGPSRRWQVSRSGCKRLRERLQRGTVRRAGIRPQPPPPVTGFRAATSSGDLCTTASIPVSRFPGTRSGHAADLPTSSVGPGPGGRAAGSGPAGVGARGRRAGRRLPRLIANTVAILAGTAESNARPEVAGKLAAVEQTARTVARRPGRPRATASCSPALPLGTNDANLNNVLPEPVRDRARHPHSRAAPRRRRRRAAAGARRARRGCTSATTATRRAATTATGSTGRSASPRASARRSRCSPTTRRTARPDRHVRRLDGRLPAQRQGRRRRPRLPVPHRREPGRHHHQPDPAGRAARPTTPASRRRSPTRPRCSPRSTRTTSTTA